MSGSFYEAGSDRGRGHINDAQHIPSTGFLGSGMYKRGLYMLVNPQFLTIFREFVSSGRSDLRRENTLAVVTSWYLERYPRCITGSRPITDVGPAPF